MTRARRGDRLFHWWILAAVASLAAVQVFLQVSFERRYPRQRIESLRYLPKGKHLKVMSLGFQNLLADALWVKAIGYFGGHNLTDKEYPWLYHILEQITTLDPPFKYPYLFGGIVLAVEDGSPRDSIKLLRKGMVQYPDEWRFPFYIGFNYFYYLKDPDQAAEHVKIAASTPGHPQYLPRLAASLMTKAGRQQSAIEFLEKVAEDTREESVRRGLYKKIEALRAGKIPEGLESFLAPEKESRDRDDKD